MKFSPKDPIYCVLNEKMGRCKVYELCGSGVRCKANQLFRGGNFWLLNKKLHFGENVNVPKLKNRYFWTLKSQ